MKKKKETPKERSERTGVPIFYYLDEIDEMTSEEIAEDKLRAKKTKELTQKFYDEYDWSVH